MHLTIDHSTFLSFSCAIFSIFRELMVFPKENLTYLDMIACKMEAVMGCRLCFDKLREIQGSES